MKSVFNISFIVETPIFYTWYWYWYWKLDGNTIRPTPGTGTGTGSWTVILTYYSVTSSHCRCSIRVESRYAPNSLRAFTHLPLPAQADASAAALNMTGSDKKSGFNFFIKLR